jgi:hypothetical protein
VSRTRFLGAQFGTTINKKMHAEKALVGAFHHAGLQGKTTEDNAVKLVKRKA